MCSVSKSCAWSCGNCNECRTVAAHAKTGYASPEDAAVAFANEIYSSSLYIRHEYGTLIYSITVGGVTRFYYADPVAGNPHGTGTAYLDTVIPAGVDVVATAHTHPNSNTFSSSDISNANKRGLDNYVLGPSLNVLKYDVSAGQVVPNPVGQATLRPLSDIEKMQLYRRFESSWNNHTCNFLYCNNNGAWPTS